MDIAMQTANLNPVKIATIAEAVYESLLGSIVSGEIPPGTPLTMQNLAAQFEVSLMPVRDALNKLEAANVIERQKNRRVVVKPLSKDDYEELLEIRLYLEILAAKKATRHCTDEFIRELERIAREMEKAKRMTDFVDKNAKFHHTIYRAANAPILQKIIEGLWLRLSPYLHIYATGRSDHKDADTLHAGILEGMRERNSKKVCDFLKRDLQHGARAVLPVLGARANTS